MAINKVSNRYVLFSLLGMIHLLPFVNSEINENFNVSCLSPLGMENGKIKDSQITVSSVHRGSITGGQARLGQKIKPWGGWCPNTTEAGSRTVTMFDEYIQIDLLNLTKVTRVATQGRGGDGATEHVKEYKISYSRDNRSWIFYPGKDNFKEAKIFQGNKDVSTVVTNDLNPAVTVRYIRVHPGDRKGRTECMRLELYGCESEENEKGILSYSMPIGQGTKNGRIHYKDTSYTGIISNNFYKGGTGILTDGKFGPANAKEFKGEGWVGWSRRFTQSQYIPITFGFSDVRKFTDVTFTVNVNKSRDYAVFNRSKTFFSSVENGFSDASFLQYCPNVTQVNVHRYITNVTLPLCENTAKFVKMQLYFGGRFLLITEIIFNSVPVSANETQSLKNYPGDPSPSRSVARSSTKILSTGTPRGTTTERNPEQGPEVRAKSSNTPIIVVVVVSLVALLVILFGILEYRRRHRAPQILTSVNIPEAKVELGPDDCVAEPPSNNQEAATPKATDLEPIYEEVRLNSTLASYPKLHRSKQNETEASDAHIYEEILKQDSEYVIPISGQTASDEEAKLRSLPGYTKLDRSKMDESMTNKDEGYQKLLKVDSDYVIPADSKTEPCKEVGREKAIN